MERTRDRLALLLELTSGLAKHMEVQTIATFVLGVGLEAIDANRGTLCLVTPDGGLLEVVGQAGYDEGVMASWTHFPVDAPLPASDAVRTRLPVYLHSPEERASRYPMFAGIGGDGASVMLPLVTGDAALGALVLGFDGPREFNADDRSFLDALASQCAIAVDRARLFETARRRQAHLTILADMSSVFARAGDDLDGALNNLTALIAPAVADIATVHLLDSPDHPRLVARVLSDNEWRRATEQVGARPIDLSALEGLGRVLRTGQEVTWDDGELFARQIARDDHHLAALLAMNLGAGIIVPMRAGSRVLGACVFANHRPRAMTTGDRQLMRNLGERAAVLVENARLMGQRAEISQRLQAALSPPSLPHIPGFELAARYRPLGEGLDVGGDFYDVLPLTPGSWLLAVGDVTGHGVDAAAATGMVRHTIRSAAMMGMNPSQILDHVNRALLSDARPLPVGTYCTVALAALVTEEPRSADEHGRAFLEVSSAGHPPPMIRRADGSGEWIDIRGTLLGCFDDACAGSVIVELAPGDTFIAFTDGVIERRGSSGWFREDDLKNLVAANDLGADEMADLIG
ncbi:MAG: hypothetical protein QOD72_1829, partial [Acidimicrobiaceae bacterium]|nr:hypothetical protein [Acidimicrobiaceae bacterium]